jgi:hypothetical protein
VAITGKLCRNPFSTIKLSHEDGGSKAALANGFAAFPCECIIFAADDFGFVDARTAAVYSESVGKERDSSGQARIDRSAMKHVT